MFANVLAEHPPFVGRHPWEKLSGGMNGEDGTPGWLLHLNHPYRNQKCERRAARPGAAAGSRPSTRANHGIASVDAVLEVSGGVVHFDRVIRPAIAMLFAPPDGRYRSEHSAPRWLLPLGFEARLSRFHCRIKPRLAHVLGELLSDVLGAVEREVEISAASILEFGLQRLDLHLGRLELLPQ